MITDAPAAEIDRVRELGADYVAQRGNGVAERIRAIAPDGVDAVLDAALVGPSILAAIRDGGGWAVVRQQQDPTEHGIIRHNVSVVGRLSDTDGLRELAKRAAAGGLPTTIAG